MVQDAFERAMRQADFFQEVAEPRAWLRTVVVRLAVSRLRRRAVWERVRGLLSPPSDGVPALELRVALRRLPPRQRGAIVLRYWFGADTQEIAAATGLRPGSVARTLARAREALRRELG